MAQVKIFIAGAKDLTEERNHIKILVNDLNSLYSSKGINLVAYSYEHEHFNDNQEEYNRFIEKEADIVIFIFDKYIGSGTEVEFFKATDTQLRENRPEILILLHEYNEITPDIARIQGLIKGRLGDKYYIDYSNLDSLRTKVRERITRYIERNMPALSAVDAPGDKAATQKKDTANAIKPADTQKEKTAEHGISKKVRALIYSMLGIIVILAGILISQLLTSSDLLIFAGGGSVNNYIEKKLGVNIKEYPNSVYANLASGSAWSMLSEEANRYQEDGGKGQEHFSSLCLSADDIDSSFINEKTRGIFVNARIIRYSLGKEPLVVYVHNKIAADRNIPNINTTISVDSLRMLMRYALSKPDDIRIFTTSKSSGTLRRYQSCFPPADSIDLEKMLDNKKSFLYYQKSNSAYINALDIPNGDMPYIILGSEYYYPQTLDAEKEKCYTALYVSQNGHHIEKPMNLYFVGLYEDKDGEYCTIKKPIIEFFKDINAEKNIDEDTWKEFVKGRIKTDGGSLILKLN